MFVLDQTHAHQVTGNRTDQSNQTRYNDSNIQPYLHQVRILNYRNCSMKI